MQLEVERLIVQEFAVDQHQLNRSNNSAPDVLTLESPTHDDPHGINHHESEHVLHSVDITHEMPGEKTPPREPSAPIVTEQPRKESVPVKASPGKRAKKRRAKRFHVPTG